MTETIISAFRRFPKEAHAVGHIMASYSTLELELCFCVGVVLDDFDMAFKAMYRPRGESQRIGVADAMGRKSYYDLKLGTIFSETIGGMRHCMKIRNQFAHCQWHDENTGRFCFVDLEELAKGNAVVKDLVNADYSYLDMDLLDMQQDYFVYVFKSIRYLNFEGRKRAGKLSSHAFSMPKKRKRPSLGIP